VWVSTNIHGSKVKRYVDIDDDMKYGDIDEIAEETMNDMINWNYEIIEDGE
jgi:hypothetical protein